jgi:glucoamylase
LRALALIPYAHFLLDRAWPADCEYVRTHLYDPHVIREPGKLIKNDLEEVSGGWWLGGFDLWEETYAAPQSQRRNALIRASEGHHLFTLLVSLRALQAGAHLASRLSDVGAADFYTAQAKRIGSRLGDFWAPQGYWRATLPSSIQGEPQLAIGAHLRRQRTGLDCALPLAVIHAGERGNSTGQGNASFDAADSRVLASLHQYIESFDGLYKINEGKPWTEGWAVGRYAEDLYNGVGKSRGNPWLVSVVARTWISVAEL